MRTTVVNTLQPKTGEKQMLNSSATQV